LKGSTPSCAQRARKGLLNCHVSPGKLRLKLAANSTRREGACCKT